VNHLREFLLRTGDDALIAAQRLGEWSAAAPELEEDIALANIALDQLGVARLLLTYAGEVERAGRDEDALAFLRDDADFRNCLLVELPNAGPAAAPHAPGDFAITMAKLLLLSVYQHLLYQQLMDSTDERLRDIAAKARKESAYHVDHATQWTIRLGDGTDESKRRMQAAVDDVWPYTHELFGTDPATEGLAAAGIAPDPASLRRPWLETVSDVLAVATLTRPADGWSPGTSQPRLEEAPRLVGGRAGRHTEHLSYLLTEMQALHRAHPGATW
jgi:ring-1,2-phenylacetyl-CoA epoxidase subunit PaaC